MNDIKNDINLKEAVSRREQQLPPMPEGLNEKVMGSLEEYDCLKKKTPLHRGRGWRWVFLAAACVAGFVVIFLAPPKSAEKQPPLALEKPRVESQEPRVKGQESRVESQESRVESQEPTVNSRRPKAKNQRPKAQKQNPVEEPLLAEAETVEEFPTEAAYQEFLDKMRKPSTSSYATQTQEIRRRGEQVTQYVAMLNQQIRAEQQYVEY